jgi:CO/xanthine dehydrogenase Mo-binding subunit
MFVEDMAPDGALYGRLIRSPVPAGRLTLITAPALPEGYRLLAAGDIPGVNALAGTDMPLLAERNVSYIGEPVALLVGAEKARVMALAERVVVSVAETQARLSIQDALPAGSSVTSTESGAPAKTASALVVDGSYETGIQEHWPSTPAGAIAEYHPTSDGDTLHITVGTTRPERAREAVMAATGVERVVVEVAEVGSHLDGKTWYPATLAALAGVAALVMRATVKLCLTREEDYRYAPKRAPSIITIKSALDADGHPIDTRVDARVGFGAYLVDSEDILATVAASLTGLYKTGHLYITRAALRYNVPPTGAYAGAGGALAAFAMERHVAKICFTLNEEGAEWRRAHLLGKLKTRFELVGKKPALTGDDMFSQITQDSGYKRKWAVYELLRQRYAAYDEQILPQRGIGFALCLAESAEVAGDKAQQCPVAAAVVEVEVDRINYAARIRGLWLYVSGGPVSNRRTAEQLLRSGPTAALGWASTEKIKFIDGRVTPARSALYQLLPASATPCPRIALFCEPEHEAISDERLTSLPFSVIPAAYTQAITQAADFHFTRIPITGEDVWRVERIRKQQRDDDARKINKKAKED